MPLFRMHKNRRSAKKGVLSFFDSRKCGVVCTKCGWRGYRIATFSLDIGRRLDKPNATGLIKGFKSHLNCPHCAMFTIVFTHVV